MKSFYITTPIYYINKLLLNWYQELPRFFNKKFIWHLEDRWSQYQPVFYHLLQQTYKLPQNHYMLFLKSSVENISMSVYPLHRDPIYLLRQIDQAKQLYLKNVLYKLHLVWCLQPLNFDQNLINQVFQYINPFLMNI